MGKATGEFKRAQRETELELRKLDLPIRREAGSISHNMQKLAKDPNIKTEGKDEKTILDEMKALKGREGKVY